MMQATPTQMGIKRALRQQAMRDQDRERAMFKDAAYRAKLDEALQHQIALSGVEQRQEAAAELQRLSDVYEQRVDRIGEAHVEAALYMQQQNEARAAQERRLAVLNELQEQRFHSALSVVKTHQGVAKAQAAAVQQRRAHILRAERDKAQAFSAEQAGRTLAQKRRQADLARQELERRKRSPNGLAMDFRQTRLHEGQGTPPPVAEPAVVVPPLPGGIESAEELQHRAAIEKRRREAAAAEAEIRAQERFLAAQAKLRAEAQKKAVEAELAELASQRLQAKKHALAAHRMQLRDQRKQQELQRVFEDNFLSGTAVVDDDLAPRALPAFLQPVPAASPMTRPGAPVTAAPAGAPPWANGWKAPLPPLPVPPPCSMLPQPPAIPRWSKCRTAPLGRQPPPPPLPVAWSQHEAPAPPPKEEVAVQTDSELLAPANGQLQQPSASNQEGSPLEPVDTVSTATRPETEIPAVRRLAWSDLEPTATPVPTVTGSAAPHKTPLTEVTVATSCDAESPELAPPQRQADTQRPSQSQSQLADLQLRLSDGDDEVDTWGEEEVDRELARMKKELGIEDSDWRSSISSIDSGVSVPSFLKDAAVAAVAVRQVSAHKASRTAAVRAAASSAALTCAQAEDVGSVSKAAADGLPSVPSFSPMVEQTPQTAATNAAMPQRERLAPALTAAGGGSSGAAAGASRSQPVDGIAEAVAALDALGAILQPAATLGRRAEAGSISPADTLDSSILRILDSSPSSSSMTTPTPVALQTGGVASRQARAAALAINRTPGASSLPSDLDDVLLLSELDWEELEALAGLRGTGVKQETTSPAGSKRVVGTMVMTPIRIAGTGALGVPAEGRFRGLSPSSTFSEVSSSVSNDSLQRLVAQGILPPDIATLLASTPPSAGGPSKGAQPPASAAPAAVNRSSLALRGTPTATQSTLRAAAPAVAAAVSGAVVASPTSSTISDLASLLGQLGLPTAAGSTKASKTSVTSPRGTSILSSLSGYTQETRNGPVPAPASTTAEVARLAAQGRLFPIPEGVTISLGNLSAAAALPSHGGPAPDAAPYAALLLNPQPGRQVSAQPPWRQRQQQQQQERFEEAVLQQPQSHEQAATATTRQGHAPRLPEPVRLSLSDLNRQLLSSTAGVASSRAASTVGTASPSGVPRPTKPGPLIITSGTEPEVQHVLAPSGQQELAQKGQGLQQHTTGLDAPAASLSSTSLTVSLSLSSMSSLSLSPAKQTHYKGGASQSHLVPGSTAAEAHAQAKFPEAIAANISDTRCSLGLGQLQSSGMPAAPAAASQPESARVVKPPSKAAGFVAAANLPTGLSSSSPYDMYDKEAARLAELMATINASLRQSSEAVARASGSSCGTSSSVSGVVAPPATSMTTAGTISPSRGTHSDSRQRSQHQQDAATATEQRGASESSVSPPSTCGSSRTSSSLLPLQSPQPRPASACFVGSQSPVAAMLQSARTAAAAAAATAAVASARNAVDKSAAATSAGGSRTAHIAMVTAAPSLEGCSNCATVASSSSVSAGTCRAAAATSVAVAAPPPKWQHDTMDDGRRTSGSVGPTLPCSTSASSLPSADSGCGRTVAMAAAASDAAVAAMAATAAPGGGDGGVDASGASHPDSKDHDVASTPVRPGTTASAVGAFDTASMTTTTPSSVLSSLSSVFAMLRMGASTEPRPPSDAGPTVVMPQAAALSRLAQPGSPPPPPPAVSPAPSIPSPPPTPYSPILSESSYSSSSVPAATPTTALAVPLAALGSRTVTGPQPAPGAPNPTHGPKPAAPSSGPRAPLSISLSSSDGVSSVAEAIAGFLAQRAHGGSQPPAAPPPPPHQRQGQPPQRPHQQESAPTIAAEGEDAGASLTYSIADNSISTTGDGGGISNGRRGSHGIEVWASLTGQTLAEALAELEGSGEPYEDLLRSSLALSSSSFSSGGALGDDDPQLLQGTLAPSAAQEVLQLEATGLEEGQEAAAVAPQLEPAHGAEQAVGGDAEREGPQGAKTERLEGISWLRPGSANQLLADVDAALARITSGATTASVRQSSETQPVAVMKAAGVEVTAPLSSLSVPRGPSRGGANDGQRGMSTTNEALSAVPVPLPPGAAVDSELRSSADSDDFGSIMAGLMQDIKRGLAALQVLPEHKELEPPAPERREPASAGGDLAIAMSNAAGAVTEGPATGLLESANSNVASAPWEEDSDEKRKNVGGVAWWPKPAVQAPQATAGQVTERPMVEGRSDISPEGESGDVRAPSPSSSVSSKMSGPATRQLLQMPTLSRGVADAPSGHATRGSNEELWYVDPTAAGAGAGARDIAAAAPATIEDLGGASRGPSRRVSYASGASSGAASSVTLGPVDTATGVNWPGQVLVVASGPSAISLVTAAVEGGAYSFLQPPRASMARNRTPSSVQSGAESPSRAQSGFFSSPSVSVSTVSSLDSLTNALAQYPVFGGATQSPMGSQSPASSDGSPDGAAGGTGSVSRDSGDDAETTQLEATVVLPQLPIQYEPSQPLPAAPMPFSAMEQEPWRGAWDPPLLPARPATAVAGTASADDPVSTELLGLHLEAAPEQTQARRGSLGAEASADTEAQASICQDISFGAASLGSGDLDGELYEHAEHGHGQGSGSQTSSLSQQVDFPAAALHEGGEAHPAWGFAQPHLEAESGSRAEPDTTTLDRAHCHPDDAETLAHASHSSVDEHGQHQEQEQHQELSSLQRRYGLALQPLTLEIPTLAVEQLGCGVAALAATATPAMPGLHGTGEAPLGVDADAGRKEHATVLQTPLTNHRIGLPATGLEEERPLALALPNREHGDMTQRRGGESMGALAGGNGGSGGGGGGAVSGGYVGALSEELLADLLMWTVSDFFSSPGSAGGTDVDH